MLGLLLPDLLRLARELLGVVLGALGRLLEHGLGDARLSLQLLEALLQVVHRRSRVVVPHAVGHLVDDLLYARSDVFVVLAHFSGFTKQNTKLNFTKYSEINSA